MSERDERRHNLKGYAALLREAQSHAMGAQSIRPSGELGRAINCMNALESAAMKELHAMGTPGEEKSPDA